MADKKVVVDVNVDASASVNSMKSIKAEIKSLQGAALQGNQDAIKRIAELKDKIEDLGDATKTLKGSGVEKVTSSFGLLGQGFKDFDFDKIKTGFKGIGSAMSAIPIFLVAEGVAYLVENWKELGEGNGIVAKGIQLLNKAFDEITGTITTFTDLIGLTNSALDKQGEAIQTNADKAKEALSNQNAEYDRQIRVAKAAGKSTVELEQAKQKAIIDTNLAVARQIEAFVRAGGEFDEEKRKLLTASLEAIKNAKVTEFEINKTEEKKTTDNYLKNLEEKKKAGDQARKEKYQKDQELLMQSLKDEEYLKAQDELDKKRRMEDADALAQYEADKLNYSAQIQEEVGIKEKSQNDKLEQDKREAIDASFRHAKLMADNLQALSDIGFSAKLAKVKKGSAEEEALMRKQFEVNKKLQVAQTVISTITGAREAYKSLATIPIVGPGLGIAAAAAATLAGLSAIQKINSTKFEGATAPTPDSGGGGVGSVGASNNAPSTTNAPSTQPFTKLDESGRNQSMPTVKAYVVESEMTDSQKRVGRLESQASF